MQSFDLVILDCDGVLIDSEMISAALLAERLAVEGVTVDLAFVFDAFVGRSFATIARDIERRFGRILPDRFEQDYRARLIAEYERSLQAVAGARQVLEALRVPFCVASSSTAPRVARSLAIAGLEELAGANVFTAEQVRKGKPAPDLFLHAAERMGVDARRCLVVEDSDPGIEAALAAGMTPWRFTGGGHFRIGYAKASSTLRVGRSFSSMEAFFDPVPELRKTA